MNKKIIAAALAVSLCLGSCAGNSDSGEKTSSAAENNTATSAAESAAAEEENPELTIKGTGYRFTVDKNKWTLSNENVGNDSENASDAIFTYHNEYEFQYKSDKKENNCVLTVLRIDINEDVLNKSAEGTGEDIDTAMTEGIVDIGRAIASDTVDLAGGDEMLEDGETTFCGVKAYKFKYKTKTDETPMTVTNYLAYHNRKMLLFSTYGLSGSEDKCKEDIDKVRESFKFE